MDDTTVNEEAAIAVHEIGGGQSLTGVLHLRVAERQPYLRYLIRGKETVNDLYICTQEGNILPRLP